MQYTVQAIVGGVLLGCTQPSSSTVRTAIPTEAEIQKPPRPSPTQEDLRILDRADSLLSSPEHWEQSANPYGCQDDQDRYSLFCALLVASEEVLGAYEHRRPALQEVRHAIEEAAGDTSYARRLLDFNADPDVTFEAVKSILAKARAAIRQRLEE